MNVPSCFKAFCNSHCISYLVLAGRDKDVCRNWADDDGAAVAAMTRASFDKLLGICHRSGTEDLPSEWTFAPLSNGALRISTKGPMGEAPVEVHCFDVLSQDYDLVKFQIAEIDMLRHAIDIAPSGKTKMQLFNRIHTVAKRYHATSSGAVANIAGSKRISLPIERFSSSGPAIEEKKESAETPIENNATRIEAVKKDLLSILAEIDRLCNANGIEYFASAGTLLGAIRHQGFIPWDDDIDIGMVRADYERFLSCAEEQLGERFFLQARQTDPQIPYLFSKVRMNGTEYVTSYIEHRDMHKGISVDIFPFEPTPIDEIDFNLHYAVAKRLEKAHRKLVRKQPPADSKRLPNSSLADVAAHAIFGAHRAYYGKLKSLSNTQAAFDHHVRQYEHDPRSTHAVSYNMQLACLSYDELYPLKRVAFEDTTIPVPNDPSIILVELFGEDYLNLPPEDQRHGHEVVRWRTSNGESSS